MNKFKILKSAKKILIATNNPGKFKEIKELLPRKIRYFKPKDFNMKEPIENGKTFQANAKIKSLYGAKSSNIVCISDDSGIEISELLFPIINNLILAHPNRCLYSSFRPSS